MDALNKKNYGRFMNTCKGERIESIRLEEENHPVKVVFRLSAVGKGNRVHKCEWVVEKKDRPPTDVDAELETVRRMIKREFHVTDGSS